MDIKTEQLLSNNWAHFRKSIEHVPKMLCSITWKIQGLELGTCSMIAKILLNVSKSLVALLNLCQKTAKLMLNCSKLFRMFWAIFIGLMNTYSCSTANYPRKNRIQMYRIFWNLKWILSFNRIVKRAVDANCVKLWKKKYFPFFLQPCAMEELGMTLKYSARIWNSLYFSSSRMLPWKSNKQD